MVQSAVARRVAQEVLGGGEDTCCEAFRAGVLDASHIGGSEHSGQHRVLSVGLLHPAPARIPSDVEHGGQGLARSDGQHLRADVVTDPFEQVGVEGGTQPDALGELDRVTGTESGYRLLVDHRGNSEARVLHQPALDLVREACQSPGPQARRCCDPGDLPGSVGHQLSGLPFGEVALVSLALDELGRPDTAELRQLLGQGHLRDERLHAFGCQGRVGLCLSPGGSGHATAWQGIRGSVAPCCRRPPRTRELPAPQLCRSSGLRSRPGRGTARHPGWRPPAS